MPRLNEDGNLLGRCAALAIILVSTAFVAKVWCGGCCPASAAGASLCPFHSR